MGREPNPGGYVNWTQTTADTWIAGGQTLARSRRTVSGVERLVWTLNGRTFGRAGQMGATVERAQETARMLLKTGWRR